MRRIFVTVLILEVLLLQWTLSLQSPASSKIAPSGSVRSLINNFEEGLKQLERIADSCSGLQLDIAKFQRRLEQFYNALRAIQESPECPSSNQCETQSNENSERSSVHDPLSYQSHDSTTVDEFPLDEIGRVKSAIVGKYKGVEIPDHADHMQKLYLFDVKRGSGDRVARDRHEVRIHFDVYDSTRKLIKTTQPQSQDRVSKRGTLNVVLCRMEYAGGLEAGIIGMREDGVRRIIVPSSLINNKKLKVPGASGPYYLFEVKLERILREKWTCGVIKHQSLSHILTSEWSICDVDDGS